jgi:hypothetical protein
LWWQRLPLLTFIVEVVTIWRARNRLNAVVLKMLEKIGVDKLLSAVDIPQLAESFTGRRAFGTWRRDGSLLTPRVLEMLPD